MKQSPSRGPKLVKAARRIVVPRAPPLHPFDVSHGTETSGIIPAKHLRTGLAADRHVTAYYGVAPSILRALLARWSESMLATPLENWTFLDVGAGKGRAMLIAAEQLFREVIGIELNAALATIARTNVSILEAAHVSITGGEAKRLAPMRLIQGDALTLPLAPVPTLALLFHPFERAALRAFLRNVERTFAGHPGLFDVLYINAEHLGTFRLHRAFSVLWEGPVPMSAEDHRADLDQIATQREYGSTGDEHCAILRFTGRASQRSP